MKTEEKNTSKKSTRKISTTANQAVYRIGALIERANLINQGQDIGVSLGEVLREMDKSVTDYWKAQKSGR